jgi:hypothetical protein
MTLRLFDIEDRPVAVLEGMSAWVWRDGRWRDAPGLARKDGVPLSLRQFLAEFGDADLAAVVARAVARLKTLTALQRS